jgi:hypothetical protein
MRVRLRTSRRPAIAGPCWNQLAPTRATPPGFRQGYRAGLTVRGQWGPQYIADACGNELACPRIAHSYSLFPQTAVQRRDRTFHPPIEGTVPLAASLRAPRVSPHDHRTLIERSNHHGLTKLLDHRTPAVARGESLAATLRRQKSSPGHRVRYTRTLANLAVPVRSTA